MKISKRTTCIIISLMMLLPLGYTIATYYPGTVLTVSNPSDKRFGSRMNRITDGTEITVVCVLIITLLSIIWIGIYEKDTNKPKKRKKI